MSVFPDKNSSVSCRNCGFSIKIRQTNHDAPVFCPSCGEEQPLQGPADKEVLTTFRKTSELEKRIKPERFDVDSRTMSSRYGILFFTVCLQFAILVFSPFFVQNWIKESVPKKHSETLSEKQEGIKTKEQVSSSEAILASIVAPPVQTDKTHPVIARQVDVSQKPTTKPPSASSDDIKLEKSTTTIQSNEFMNPFAVALAAVQDSPPVQTKPIVEQNPVSVWETIPSPESISTGFTAPEIISQNSDLKNPAFADSKTPITDSGLSQYELRLTKAKEKLSESYSLIALDPERALTETFLAVRMFEDLGQSIPSLAYWAIAQSYASQSWGESLIESSPPIESLAVSSDSRWLLTQTDDNTVWIWDIFRTQKSAEGFRLDASETPFVKLLFTPDFRLAIGGETNGTIRIWDTARKRPSESTITIKGTLQNIRDLQISPDGRWLAAYAGCSDLQSEHFSTVPIQASYTTTEQHLKQKNDQQAYPVFAPSSLRPRQTILPTSEQQKNTRKAEAGRIILVNYQDRSLSGIAVDAAVSGSNIVWLWDLDQIRSGNIPQPIALRGHEHAIMTMKISADSHWLVTGSEDGTARIYNLKGSFPGADQAVLKGHELGITSIAIPSQGNWVATGSRDNTIRIWSLPDSDSPTSCTVLTGHIGWISALAVDESGQRLISGSYDQTIRIWTIPRGKIDLSNDNPPLVIQNDQGPIRELLLSKDGKMLVSLGGDASLRVRELNGELGQVLRQEIDPKHSLMIRNRMLPITRVLLTPDDQWLVFNYVNQRNLQNSGVRLWPIRLKDLMECASAFGN